MKKLRVGPLRRWRRVLLWALFAVGVLLQAFGPHLKVRDNRFILPPSLISAGKEIRPAQIVAQERRIQLLSGILTLAGALGLAIVYSKVLDGRRSTRHDLVDGSQAASTCS
jgi:NhaP-type Na+/H+ or K+/H+ antiporter